MSTRPGLKRFVLALSLLAAAGTQAAALHDPLPDIASAYFVEIDGRPLWAHHPQRRLPAASLVKLMTALLVIEQRKPDTLVTVDRSAAHESGIGIKPGEKFHAHDLLAAMLIASANDACRALADSAAGGESRFVQQMNRRAQQLGMRDTHYVNACGRDAARQTTSAHDLALLAQALLEHPGITALTARRGMRIATTDGRHSFSFSSRNGLIGRYRGVLGLKTGYTRRAGRCQVIYAERDGHKVLLIMLHARRWDDAANILDLAFDRARRKT